MLDSDRPTVKKSPCVYLFLLPVQWSLLFVALFAKNWLRSLLAYLDVSQAPEKADFIVVLGGGTGNRAAMGGQLFKNKFAPRIIVTGDTSSVNADLIVLTQSDIDTSNVFIDTTSTTTWSEAEKLVQMLAAYDAQKVLIVTDAAHTRRARAVYKKISKDYSIKLIFVAPSESKSDMWWEDARLRRLVTKEYAKMIYYLVEYGVKAW